MARSSLDVESGNRDMDFGQDEQPAVGSGGTLCGRRRRPI